MSVKSCALLLLALLFTFALLASSAPQSDRERSNIAKCKLVRCSAPSNESPKCEPHQISVIDSDAIRLRGDCCARKCKDISTVQCDVLSCPDGETAVDDPEGVSSGSCKAQKCVSESAPVECNPDLQCNYFVDPCRDYPDTPIAVPDLIARANGDCCAVKCVRGCGDVACAAFVRDCPEGYKAIPDADAIQNGDCCAQKCIPECDMSVITCPTLEQETLSKCPEFTVAIADEEKRNRTGDCCAVKCIIPCDRNIFGCPLYPLGYHLCAEGMHAVDDSAKIAQGDCCAKKCVKTS